MSVVLEAAAERVGQQLLGHRARELLGPAAGSPAAARPGRRPSCRPSSVLEASIADAAVARRASGRCRRSSRARSRSDPSACGSRRRPGWRGAPPCARASTAPCPAFSSSGGTFGGGGGGGVPRMFVSTYLPRMHRRGAVRVRGERQDAALAEQPAPAVVA